MDFNLKKYKSNNFLNSNLSLTSNNCETEKSFYDINSNKSNELWKIDQLLLDNKFPLKNETIKREKSIIFNENRFQNEKMSSNSNDKTEHKSEFAQFKKRYIKKLPLHFMDSKDWQLYLQFTSAKDSLILNSSKSRIKAMFKYIKSHGDRTERLLNSIYNLYKEYSQLNDDYEGLQNQFFDKKGIASSTSSEEVGDIIKDTNINLIGRQFNIAQKILPMNIPEISLPILKEYQMKQIQNENFTQTDPVLDYLEKRKKDVLNSNNDTFKDTHNALTGNTNKTRTSPQFEELLSYRKSKSTKTFDQLIKQNYMGQQLLDIVEEFQANAPSIIHKINLTNYDNYVMHKVSDSTKQTNSTFNNIAAALRCISSKPENNNNILSFINLPILLDLILPKMQKKIQEIFKECSFLCNPLEVLAELRNYNYNKMATIQHFNDTKILRDSITDFISNDIDKRSVMVINKCLNRNIKNEKMNISSCLNCGKDLEETSLSKSEINHFSNEDEFDYTKSLNDDKIFRSVQLAALEADKATIKLMSKHTDMEPGIFSKAVMDSFSQTLNKSVKLYPRKLEEFAIKVIKIISHLRKSIKETKLQMSHLRRQVSSLLKALRNNIDVIIRLSSKQFITDHNKNRIVVLSNQVEELKLKLKDEEIKRRLAYNLMQEQMGNVRVYCRCRDIPNSNNILEVKGNESIILPIFPHERFDFDNVFPSNMSQNEIYEEFKPLVMSFIDGFNVCFITYGSEASGKTYTLIGGNLGEEEEHGIMQRALNTVLNEQELRSRDWDYKISACLIEIYNDSCIDILSGESGIQMYVDCGMEAVFQKLKSVPITNESDAEVLLHLCRVKRKVAKTALNPESSRSHLITLIRLQGQSKIHGENIRSFMCLCDLAGFEDIIKAETQTNKVLAKEAGYINKSLTAFNRVFVSLRRQDPNTVCYRDSKLTHLLKPFLTNSGKCALVITIRTDHKSLGSTQNTLRFGRETRGVSLGKARRQISNN